MYLNGSQGLCYVVQTSYLEILMNQRQIIFLRYIMSSNWPIPSNSLLSNLGQMPKWKTKTNYFNIFSTNRLQWPGFKMNYMDLLLFDINLNNVCSGRDPWLDVYILYLSNPSNLFSRWELHIFMTISDLTPSNK